MFEHELSICGLLDQRVALSIPYTSWIHAQVLTPVSD